MQKMILPGLVVGGDDLSDQSIWNGIAETSSLYIIESNHIQNHITPSLLQTAHTEEGF